MHSILIVLSCHVMTCTQFKLPREKFYRENDLKENQKMLRESRKFKFLTAQFTEGLSQREGRASKGSSYRESTVSTNRHPIMIEGMSTVLTNLSNSVTKLSCTHNHFHLKDKSFGHTSIHKMLKNFLLVQSDWRKDTWLLPTLFVLGLFFLLISN